MTLDISALKAAVAAVDPGATVERRAGHIRVVTALSGRRIELFERPDGIEFNASWIRTARDRAILRAVIDELDRQGFR